MKLNKPNKKCAVQCTILPWVSHTFALTSCAQKAASLSLLLSQFAVRDTSMFSEDGSGRLNDNLVTSRPSSAAAEAMVSLVDSAPPIIYCHVFSRILCCLLANPVNNFCLPASGNGTIVEVSKTSFLSLLIRSVKCW